VSSPGARCLPADAAEYGRSVLAHLGKPGAEVKATPSPKTAWICIDGDVRIRFSESAGDCADSPRNVSLEVLVWPTYLQSLEAEVRQPTELLPLQARHIGDSARRRWADKTAPPLVEKPPPDALYGLRLRMMPWQVREVAPGIHIESRSPSVTFGEFRRSDATECQVRFWREAVSEVHCQQASHQEVDKGLRREGAARDCAYPSAYKPSPQIRSFF
jgi:hypothetical protein